MANSIRLDIPLRGFFVWSAQWLRWVGGAGAVVLIVYALSETLGEALWPSIRLPMVVIGSFSAFFVLWAGGMWIFAFSAILLWKLPYSPRGPANPSRNEIFSYSAAIWLPAVLTWGRRLVGLTLRDGFDRSALVGVTFVAALFVTIGLAFAATRCRVGVSWLVVPFGLAATIDVAESDGIGTSAAANLAQIVYLGIALWRGQPFVAAVVRRLWPEFPLSRSTAFPAA